MQNEKPGYIVSYFNDKKMHEVIITAIKHNLNIRYGMPPAYSPLPSRHASKITSAINTISL
jgi:hypothetical protein